MPKHTSKPAKKTPYDRADDSDLDPGEKRRLSLKRQLLSELSPTRRSWGGTAVTIARHENPVNVDHKRDVQAQGEAHGCHSCLTKLTVDADQPWIGDHIPPTKLSAAARAALAIPDTQATVLYAQCDTCAETQSALVRRLGLKRGHEVATAVAALTPHERGLLLGVAGKTSTPSSGPRVSAGEGLQVQSIGVRNGCHSCNAVRPASKYHADHCPPVLMHLPTTQGVMQKIGMAALVRYEAKPQCPKCSHNQGGSMSGLKSLITEIAVEYDMPIYWT